MNSNIELIDQERQPCEVWTRVMGYLRPVSEFNKGKKSEFCERTYFTEGKVFRPYEGKISANQSGF